MKLRSEVMYMDSPYNNLFAGKKHSEISVKPCLDLAQLFMPFNEL